MIECLHKLDAKDAALADKDATIAELQARLSELESANNCSK